MGSEIFTELKPTKLLFRCAVPAAVTSVFGALYSIADGFFVGRFIGGDALAAINLIMPIVMIAEALSNMVATGASVNISMLLGAKKRDEASQVFSFSVLFIIISSCIIGALGLTFARPFVNLVAPGASAQAVQYGVEYLTVHAAFAPLILIYFATDNYLRVCGKQRASMNVNIATQIINVVATFFLVVVLHQGVTAAAVASCGSIAIGSIVTLAMFHKQRMDVYYTRGGMRPMRFLRIIANGVSEFFSSIAVSIMSVIMNLFLLRYGGTTAVAAFSILMYVDEIVGMLNFGISDSMQPAISHCYGAGLIERMKALFKRVVAASAVTSFVAFLLMLFAGPSIAGIFIKPGEEALLAMSITAVKIFSFSYLMGWVDSCFSSYFTALDRPARSLVASIFGTLVFPVATLFLLTPVFGLNGVWLTAPLSALASALLVLVLAKTMKLDEQPALGPSAETVARGQDQEQHAQHHAGDGGHPAPEGEYARAPVEAHTHAHEHDEHGGDDEGPSRLRPDVKAGAAEHEREHQRGTERKRREGKAQYEEPTPAMSEGRDERQEHRDGRGIHQQEGVGTAAGQMQGKEDEHPGYQQSRDDVERPVKVRGDAEVDDRDHDERYGEQKEGEARDETRVHAALIHRMLDEHGLRGGIWLARRVDHGGAAQRARLLRIGQAHSAMHTI
ncbi:MAG: hypothetical protein IJH83_01325 [Coriobacteriales bacterium]|nr:hypothetical protein [Coriobacteriales bacterium]